jgi:hypothetical protein
MIRPARTEDADDARALVPAAYRHDIDRLGKAPDAL